MRSDPTSPLIHQAIRSVLGAFSDVLHTALAGLQRDVDAVCGSATSRATQKMLRGARKAARQVRAGQTPATTTPRYLGPWSKHPDMPAAVAMVRAGRSQGEAARAFGLPPRAVSKACEKQGVKSTHPYITAKAAPTTPAVVN